MNANLQLRVQRYGWDRASKYYEASWQKQLHPAHEQVLEWADLNGGERVLDIACGTGLVTLPAAQAVGDKGEVVGTDLSDNMVAAIKATAAMRNLNNTSFSQMDAEDLKFEDESFDVALCALGLMYAPHPLKAIEEMHRVLRPGARAVVAVWGQRERCGWEGIFSVVDERVNTDVCPLFFQLGTKNVLQLTFQMAHFENIEIERISTVLHYDSAESACMAAFAGGPVAMAYARFDEDTRASAHADYLESIERYRIGRRYEIPGEFVIARGYKSK